GWSASCWAPRRRGSPARTSASTVATPCAAGRTWPECWRDCSGRTGCGASFPGRRQIPLERLGETGKGAEQLLGRQGLSCVPHTPHHVAVAVARLHQHPDRQGLVALHERLVGHGGHVVGEIGGSRNGLVGR